MDTYITGATIKKLREKKGITQMQLAELIGVSSKAVSKWETAKGLPDITLIEPLAKALEVSVVELMSGDTVINRNTSSNMLRSTFYVCPVCGNIIRATGNTVISCCGIMLPPLEAEEIDDDHRVVVETVEDEQFFTVCHEMTKEHFVSFMAYLTADRVQFVKFYPEGNAETRFQLRGSGYLYIYCNRHGLMRMRIGTGKR
ncbi:MAG: helix-turn-helix domain-containing protein [Lachnospiraceae bacterium]|jgi:DNA-binding XRE family transcriptional regulator/desulfoferrodoxin (superoxide reductase-like protein)|nr:helix-turn-helix domain-containing protein [Lachnospiraceae bacterium]